MVIAECVEVFLDYTANNLPNDLFLWGAAFASESHISQNSCADCASYWDWVPVQTNGFF